MRISKQIACIFTIFCAAAFAQQPRTQAVAKPAEPAPPSVQDGKVTIPAGTKIPLVLKQTVSTRNARPGDPIYAATNFPVVVDDRIIIPAGSYVQGVIDEVRRAGRVKGRAELLVHFRSLILPSGYTVTLPGAVDSAPDTDDGKVKDSEGTIQHSGEKGKDAKTVGEVAAAGAGVGSITTRTGKGALIGGGAGAAGGLVATMLMRGSDLKLASGTALDMVLERPITFDEAKLHLSR